MNPMRLNERLSVRRSVRLDVFGKAMFSTNPSLVRVEKGYLCCVKGVNYDREEIWYSSDWQASDKSKPATPAADLGCRMFDCCDIGTKLSLSGLHWGAISNGLGGAG